MIKPWKSMTRLLELIIATGWLLEPYERRVHLWLSSRR